MGENAKYHEDEGGVICSQRTPFTTGFGNFFGVQASLKYEVPGLVESNEDRMVVKMPALTSDMQASLKYEVPCLAESNEDSMVVKMPALTSDMQWLHFHSERGELKPPFNSRHGNKEARPRHQEGQ